MRSPKHENKLFFLPNLPYLMHKYLQRRKNIKHLTTPSNEISTTDVFVWSEALNCTLLSLSSR